MTATVCQWLGSLGLAAAVLGVLGLLWLVVAAAPRARSCTSECWGWGVGMLAVLAGTAAVIVVAALSSVALVLATRWRRPTSASTSPQPR
jgi:hypothetical protein